MTAASSLDSITFGPPETVTHGVDLSVADGQYLEIVVSFTRATIGETPILFDLTVTANRPPECDTIAFPNELWPPNQKMKQVAILGVTDPDGDPISLEVTAITQDEPLDTLGDGTFEPDGAGAGTDIASVRAERTGDPGILAMAAFTKYPLRPLIHLGPAAMGQLRSACRTTKVAIPVSMTARFMTPLAVEGHSRSGNKPQRLSSSAQTIDRYVWEASRTYLINDNPFGNSLSLLTGHDVDLTIGAILLDPIYI